MPVIDPENIPEGATDCTAEVNELREELNDVFHKHGLHVIAMAIGSLFGDVLDSPELIDGVIGQITETAHMLYAITTLNQEREEGTIH